METRVAVATIIVDNSEVTGELNALLHEYADYVVGRMGIPYREKKVHIICLVLDAPQDTINALSGKIGKLKDVTCKMTFSSVAK